MRFLHVLFFAAITCNILTGQAVLESITFSSFNDGDEGSFVFNNSNIYSGALQVTEESGNNDTRYMKNKSGKAIYNKQYKIWTKSSPRNTVASFNATFVINIQTKAGSGGEGLAFFITSVIGKPEESHGRWLGLFNSSTDGNDSNHMVAIEFDTRKNDGTNDPDGNHVGIDVNSINSRQTASLDSEKLDLKSSSNIQALIQYDGNDRSLRVYVANESASMPPNPILNFTIDLSDFLGQDAYFGFSASTGNDTELNCIRSWNLSIETVTSPSTSTSNSNTAVLVIALSVVAAALCVAAVVIIVLFIRYRKSREEAARVSEALHKLPGHPREFKYKDLKKATNNFSAQAELGRGGFGAVYKAILPKDKTAVAVKRLFRDAKQGNKEFISELSIINQLRHRNLVPLLGWCHDNGDLMMVYEYMPNGSLNTHIYQGLLEWEQRYNIISGVASALLYLHEECKPQVIHRDLKASNIMLDADCDGRLGDFGLARLIERDRSSYTPTDVAGTMGYIAPECFLTGRATAESDVFGFGAVVLEVACGRPPRSGGDAPDLVSWVWRLHLENKLMEAADTRLAIPANNVKEDIKCLLMVGLACSNPNPADRPTMRQVKQILCRDMPPPFVPPFRPPFVWPHPMADSSSFATSVLPSTESLLQWPDASAEGSKSFAEKAERKYRKTLSYIDL